MFLTGIILSDGRFNPQLKGRDNLLWNGRKAAYLLASADQTASGEDIIITQADVRNIQLAKAALYAGAKLLMKRAQVTRVDRIIMAGAFGSYIDPKYAMVLGLIPSCALDKVGAVGNAAGDGARIALLNRHKRQEAQEIAHWVKYIETAVAPSFQEEFVKAIHLPHASDPFPHLEGLLPIEMERLSDRPRSRKRKHRRPEVASSHSSLRDDD
jgi:uncharacterized 2Fe-2S/4Fe-4S cluster protein (DUF4445 family)